MKERISSAIVMLILISLLGSCALPSAESEGRYALYYLSEPALSAGGDAVGKDWYSEPLPEDTVQAAEQLFSRYLAGPESEALKSPLPAGVQLLGAEISGPHLYLDVSGPYGLLSGVDLTLADYCVTMTMCQIPTVSVVSITVNGQRIDYRATEDLRTRDVLLSEKEDLIATVHAKLYFLSQENGGLSAEVREIPVYEGETRAVAVLSALLRGPENGKLRTAFPEEFTFSSVRTDGDICYVNLDSAQVNLFNGDGEETALRSAADSLCSLSSVLEVRFLVDGEAAERYGAADISRPYTSEE